VAVGIKEMKVTKATTMMASPLLAGDDAQRLSSRGSTWKPVMSTDMRARMAMMPMRKKKNPKPMMDPQRRLVLTREPVMSIGMCASVVTMRIWMSSEMHRNAMMDQP